MTAYGEGFEAGRTEGARLMFDAYADGLQALATRVARHGGPAGAAANEAAAICRDAARSLDWQPGQPEANGRAEAPTGPGPSPDAPAQPPTDPDAVPDERDQPAPEPGPESEPPVESPPAERQPAQV
jgi:hypothetical protein